jgi:hypothetical protein
MSLDLELVSSIAKLQAWIADHRSGLRANDLHHDVGYLQSAEVLCVLCSTRTAASTPAKPPCGLEFEFVLSARELKKWPKEVNNCAVREQPSSLKQLEVALGGDIRMLYSKSDRNPRSKPAVLFYAFISSELIPGSPGTYILTMVTYPYGRDIDFESPYAGVT